MQAPASPQAPDAAAAAIYQYAWQKPARDGFLVHVDWNTVDGGNGAQGVVYDLRDGAPPPSPFALALAPGAAPDATVVLTHGGDRIEVGLTLSQSGQLVCLNCNMPLSASEYFSDTIGAWPLRAAPPAPVPARPDAAGTAILIDAPAGAADLVPFIWMRPPGAPSSVLRFVRCTLADVRSIYDGMDAAQKTAAATAFMAGSDFVGDIAQLGATIAAFPARRQALLAQAGQVPLDHLVAEAEAQLQLPPLAAFLATPGWTAALERLWQSVFALALAGQPAQAQLGGQLTDILRVAYYLMLLGGGDPALEAAQARHAALSATAALPDQVAIVPPLPSLAGAGTGTPPDTWEVLGIGQVRMTRQSPAGYLPGALADVVNVLPHTRQEVVEHDVATMTQHDGETGEQYRHDEHGNDSGSASELADTLQEVMASGADALDMSGVTPEYGNLNMLLTGSGGNGRARADWHAAGAARRMRHLTEHAVARLGDRVSRQRGREWQALRARRLSQSTDNAGMQRLVGIYRWVDRLVRVQAEDVGPRLVVEVVVAQPAQAWTAAVAAQPPQPLTAPPALPADRGAITPDNYLDLGAGYGLLDLEAPPADEIVLSARVDNTTAGDMAALCVPAGYAATGGSVTTAVSDAGCTLACSIGGVDVTPAAAIAAPPLTVAVPATSGTASALVAPGAAPACALHTTTLASLPIATGRIPLTVISTAPAFCVTVMLTCARTGAGSAADPLLAAWQMRIYARLRQAWQAAWNDYDTALQARIQRAGGHHTAALQRAALKAACLQLLSTNAAAPRFPQSDFDWQHMTWQYESPLAPDAADWPQHDAGERTAPSSTRLFQRFLTARSARLLVPACPGTEADLLFRLQFGRPWIGPAAPTPVTEGTIELLAQLDAPVPAPLDGPAEQWTLRIPTSMLYLQEGAELPGQPPAAAT